MASQLQANDSQFWRRIVPGFGEPGVTSWNGRTGDVIGTLANIYSFGQGDSPTVDNRFTGPGYAWSFPLGDVGGNTYAIGAFEANVNSDQTYWNYVRRAGDHTINTSRTFNLWSINDPTWNGSAGTLASVQAWITDDVRYGGDATEPIVSQAQLGVGSYEWRDGGVLFFDATNATSSFNQQPGVKRLARRHYLWDQAVGAPQFVDNVDGYGNRIVTSIVGINGVIPVDIAQVRYTLGALNPDDGFGYFLCTGFLEDLNGTEAKGSVTVNSVAGGSSDGAWYQSFSVSKGPVPGNLVNWLRGYSDVGAKIMVGGLQLPSSPTLAVSDAGTARLRWDDPNGIIELSADGGAYAPFSGAMFITAQIDLTASPATYVLSAPKGFRCDPIATHFVVTATSTVTVAPTVSCGSDAGATNLNNSQTAAGFLTAAAGQRVALVMNNVGGFVPAPDLTANGLVFKVTAAATATTLKGYMVVQCTLVPVN